MLQMHDTPAQSLAAAARIQTARRERPLPAQGGKRGAVAPHERTQQKKYEANQAMRTNRIMHAMQFVGGGGVVELRFQQY